MLTDFMKNIEWIVVFVEIDRVVVNIENDYLVFI